MMHCHSTVEPELLIIAIIESRLLVIHPLFPHTSSSTPVTLLCPYQKLNLSISKQLDPGKRCISALFKGRGR